MTRRIHQLIDLRQQNLRLRFRNQAGRRIDDRPQQTLRFGDLLLAKIDLRQRDSGEWRYLARRTGDRMQIRFRAFRVVGLRF